MRSRTLNWWPLAASLLLHAAAVLAWVAAAGSGSAPEPVARDVWVGRSVFVEMMEERAPTSDARSQALPIPPDPSQPAAPVATPAVVPGAVRAPRRPAAKPHRAAAEPRPTPERGEPATDEAPAARGGQSGDFGAEGLPNGVRRLAVAFTRAVPAATSRDPVWLSLPLGTAGSVRVEIRVDEAGHIVRTKTLDPSPAPEHLARLLERTLLLLQKGRFAVSGVSAGDAEVFRIDVHVSMKDATEGFEAGQVVRLGFEPPDARGRGKAFFTLGSGRHVEAAIRVERKRG